MYNGFLIFEMCVIVIILIFVLKSNKTNSFMISIFFHLNNIFLTITVVFSHLFLVIFYLCHIFLLLNLAFELLYFQPLPYAVRCFTLVHKISISSFLVIIWLFLFGWSLPIRINWIIILSSSVL